MGEAITPAKIPLTWAEYRGLPDDGRRYELIEGDLFVTPAPASFHQTVSRRLQHAMMTQLEDTGIAEVFDAPIDVHLSETSIVQPDLALVRLARTGVVSRRGIEGAPDLIVEILSPGTADRDRYLKRALYARHSVPEYWIVESERGGIELHRVTPSGYELTRRFDRASTLTSPEFPELSIPLEPIFRSR